MQRILTAIVIVGFFGTTLSARAQMTSPSFEIRWDTVGDGGDDTSSSASYILRDTAGATGSGPSSSTSFDLEAGYRAGVFDQVIDFAFFSEDASSERDATAVAGTTITCSTVALVVGDMIALIQDRGAAQVSAVGKIVSIGVGTVTVDEFVTAGTDPVIDSSNDYVVELSGTTTNLGELDSSEVSTSIVGMEVTADINGGYVVQVMDDDDLSAGADTINDVADGAVTAGSEEYGGRSSDTSLADSTFDSSDTAFTTSFQDIVSESGVQFDNRSFLTLKTAISSSTADGAYSQSLTIIVSGNY